MDFKKNLKISFTAKHKKLNKKIISTPSKNQQLVETKIVGENFTISNSMETLTHYLSKYSRWSLSDSLKIFSCFQFLKGEISAGLKCQEIASLIVFLGNSTKFNTMEESIFEIQQSLKKVQNYELYINENKIRRIPGSPRRISGTIVDFRKNDIVDRSWWNVFVEKSALYLFLVKIKLHHCKNPTEKFVHLTEYYEKFDINIWIRK